MAHEGPPWARFPLATGGLEERERLRTPGHRWLLLGGRRTAQGETVKEPVDAGFTKSAEEPWYVGGLSVGYVQAATDIAVCSCLYQATVSQWRCCGARTGSAWYTYGQTGLVEGWRTPRAHERLEL